MSQVLYSLIIDVIELGFVLHIANVVSNDKKGVEKIILCLLLCFPGLILLEDTAWNTYIIKKIYLMIVLLFYLYKHRMKIGESISVLCALFSVCEVLKILAAVIGSICAMLFSMEEMSNKMLSRVLSLFFMIVFILASIYIIKFKVVKLKFSFFKKCMVCFTYVFIVLSKIPFLYTDIKDGRIWKMIFVTIICCTIIFFVISRIERHNVEMERAKMEENNKNLSSKLHKSQEILPVMVQVLSNVTESSGKEMEEQETQKLLNEMTDLFGRQLKENSKEDLQLKNFCSTGLKILDQRLKVYQMEAVDRDVNLDIYVQAPIDDIIKENDIDQLKLLRAVGDLVRNAFRVIEKNRNNVTINQDDNKCRARGHILLIIGCRYEGVLEIAVVDNGEEFPLHVIEAFGRRGVTTNGTGNGLADLMEFAEETQASICVEEFARETNAFTKRVSITFDKCRQNYFKSERNELITSSLWKKLNIV